MKIQHKKKTKKAQVMVEFVMVLGLSLSLIGFVLSGFQVMHTKMVFNIAAYEGARNGSLKSTSTHSAKQLATNIIRDNTMNNSVNNFSVTVSSLSGGYTRCVVKGDIKYMFPILDPSFRTSGIKQSTVTTQFTVKNER